jgi:hypothetical protein
VPRLSALDMRLRIMSARLRIFCIGSIFKGRAGVFVYGLGCPRVNPVSWSRRGAKPILQIAGNNIGLHGEGYMVRNNVLVLSLVLLSGCVTTGKECTPPEPPTDKAGELIVYRPSQGIGSFVDYPISLDDCIVGWLADGSIISHKVTAGAVKVRAEKRALQMGGAEDIRAGVPVGGTVYVRFWHLTPTAPKFAVVDQATEKEMPALQQLLR